MSVASILIIVAIVWLFLIISTLLVLAALMRSSQLSQREEAPNELSTSDSQRTRTEIRQYPVANY